MAAGGIYYQGQIVRKPGAYSTVDADGLASPGIGALGIVAILGTCEGMIPGTAVVHGRDLPRIRRLADVRKLIRSGDIREAAIMAFDPAIDERVAAGAAEIVVAKGNPSTQSTVTLANAQGDAVVFTSLDYGFFTRQINVAVANATVGSGRRITVKFEDTTEDIDQVGGDAVATLQYTEPTGDQAPGWDTMVAAVLSTGIRCTGTRAEVGLDDEVAAANIEGVIEVVSSNAGDTTQTATIYGLSGGDPVREEVALDGVTPVATVTEFDAGSVVGVVLSAECVGNVTVRDSDGPPTTILTVLAGAFAQGVARSSAMFVAGGAITLVADGATVEEVTLWGRTANGATVAERIALNGAVDVVTTVDTWVQIEALVLGEVEAARTVTFTAVAAETLHTREDKLTKAADYFNARQVTNDVDPADPFGFVFAIATTLTSLDPAELDLTVGTVNVDSPATGSFNADLFFFVDAINTRSQLVSAAKAVGATGSFPANTTQPVYLDGGIEGVASTLNFTTVLNRLEEIRVNTIVDLTGDPAVAALLRGHCRLMAGIGRNERDGTVGILTGAMTAPGSLTDIRTQVQALNTRHLRACGQEIQRFDSNGDLAWFLPQFQGALVAGMQAGTPVGTSLTHKVLNVQAVRNSNTWSAVRDAEALIAAGLWFAEEIDGQGVRGVRNITTYLQDENLAYVEASVNEAVNFAVFEWRTDMERAVGENTFSGTANSLRSRALKSLNKIVKTGALVTYQGLSIEVALDIADVDAELAPTVPINFIRVGAHLVNFRQAA